MYFIREFRGNLRAGPYLLENLFYPTSYKPKERIVPRQKKVQDEPQLLSDTIDLNSPIDYEKLGDLAQPIPSAEGAEPQPKRRVPRQNSRPPNRPPNRHPRLSNPHLRNRRQKKRKLLPIQQSPKPTRTRVHRQTVRTTRQTTARTTGRTAASSTTITTTESSTITTITTGTTASSISSTSSRTATTVTSRKTTLSTRASSFPRRLPK